ncbi:PREDICTED: uncharacterized protein LOC106324649 isoform X2 [Brassica oleracea var. oleracea]|uniref:uncharacterized protein LOC106324649 isoform X2 n=1 Tax=Brassica oleracea var. oleracea TaxID=109376 RepID=UPI0006A7247C|nr:PREDICTED: uncharacterized protein LOC106324649 isoform X2 [Brassica oleracea var. oleracea]
MASCMMDHIKSFIFGEHLAFHTSFTHSNASVVATHRCLQWLGSLGGSFGFPLPQGLTGNSKQDIENVGIAVRTAFSMVSLPALDRCLVDRLEALCLIRSTIAVNRSFFLLPKCSAFSDKGIGNVKTGDLQNWIGDHFLRSKNWEGMKRCMADSTICKFRPRDVDFDAKHLSHVKSPQNRVSLGDKN